MSKSNQSPVLIIGAGLAGLSLAAILQKNNTPYLLFESLPHQRTQRHGITLYPWAYLPLLNALDIGVEELRYSTATDMDIGGEGVVDTMVRDVYTGKPLELEGRTQFSGALDHAKPFRAKKNSIREFLIKRIDTTKVHWEWKLGSVKHGDVGIVAEFENGKTMEGRLLVAADGLHSICRRLVVPESKPSITSLTVYNGRRQIQRASFDTILGPYMQNIAVLSGIGDGFALEVKIDAIDEAEAVINWTYSRDSESSIDPTLQPSQPHSEIAKAIITELTQIRGLTSPFDFLINEESMKGDTIYNWVMRSIRIPITLLSASSTERLVLIGDAAHAMPIYEGTGANQAFLDSVALGGLLSGLANDGGTQQSHKSSGAQSILDFYEKAHPRWQDAVAAVEFKLRTMHRSIEFLRAQALEGATSKI